MRAKLGSRNPGFCDTCGELYSLHPPAVAAMPSHAAPDAPSRQRLPIPAVVAAAGLLAAISAVACVAAASGTSGQRSGKAGSVCRSACWPKAAAALAAMKQAAGEKPGDAGSRPQRPPVRSKDGGRLLMSSLRYLFLGGAAALSLTTTYNDASVQA